MKEKIGWTYGKHALILGAGGIGSEIGRNLVRKCRKLPIQLENSMVSNPSSSDVLFSFEIQSSTLSSNSLLT